MMLNFSDLCLAFLSIFVLFYLFISFKAAISLVLVTVLAICGVQAIFDFKSAPVRAKTVQSKFYKKEKVKQEQNFKYTYSSIKNRFFNFINSNVNDNFNKMNNSFSVIGRSPSFNFKSKSPRKRNQVGRSQSFSLPSSSVPQRQKMNQSFLPSSGALLTLPFLPRVKKALGLDSETSFVSSPRKDITQSVPSHVTHPATPSPGFLPAVRLGRREKYNLSANSSMLRSPNTVKIAPPEPHRLSTPRLLEVRNTSRSSECKRTPDTQAVVLALKEKSKKRSSLAMNEEVLTEYPMHQAKRRRQESQQSNASTSSLPPLPDNLPDLSTSGYTIPRLETPTLKRSADLSEQEWEENISAAKRLRKDNRNNSIVSSLSSMKSVQDKERQVKRKVQMDEKENVCKVIKQAKQDKTPHNNASFSMDRSDTVILPPDFDQSIGHQSTTNDTTMSDTSFILESSQSQPKVQKRVSLNQTFSARKRQMSLYSGLNKSFQKVPQANVLASMDDYDQDREAEQQRVQEMLEGIDAAEKEKQKKAETIKEQTSVISSSSTTSALPSGGIKLNSVVTSSTSNVSSVNLLTPSTSSTSNAATVSVSSTEAAASAVSLAVSSTSTTTNVTVTAGTTTPTQPQYTFKPAFGNLGSTTSANTVASSGGGFTFNTNVSQVTSAASTTSEPQSQSSELKFNFATVKSSSTTQSPTKSSNVSINLSSTAQGFGNTAVSNSGVPPPGSNTSTTMSTTTMPSTGGFGASVTPGFNFGNTSVGTYPAFGQNTSKSSTSGATNSSGITFGTNQTAGAPSFGIASAGYSTAGTSGIGSLGTFGQSSNTAPSPTNSVFGNNVTSQPTQAFAASNTTPSGGAFNFSSSTATSNPTSGFTFNSNKSTSTGNTFGTVTTSVTGGFGTSGLGQKLPPAYGAQNFTLPTSFGGQNSTTQTSTFGTPNNLNASSVSVTQTGMFGVPQSTNASAATFTFGGSKPAAATSTTSIFGNTVQTSAASSSTFAFGGSSGQTNVFQAATTQSSTNSVFGGNPSSQTSNFSIGSTQGNKQNSVFGNTQQSSNLQTSFGGTSSFGQDKSSTVFGKNPSTTQSVFPYGGASTPQQQQQPSAAFGTTTRTGFAFGGSTAATFGGSATTTQQSGGAPVFGGTNNTTSSTTSSSNVFAFGNSTPVKSGFDFSSSAGAGTSGFNFGGANASSFGTPQGTTPVVGFGTPTQGVNPAPGFGTPNAGVSPAPGFGTPNMFSIGSSNTSARPARAGTKLKRRGTVGRR